MDSFIDIFKRNKRDYLIIISLTATILLITTVVDFAEKVIKYPMLFLLSIAIFYFLYRIALQEELWNNEK